MTNYTLGRGKLYMGRFLTGTQNPEGERYIGNTPEFNLSLEASNLDHFSSDGGIREKDDSVALEVTRSGSFITDSILPENLALFFFGSSSTLVQSTLTVTDELIPAVLRGMEYQLGTTPQRPAGHRGLTPQVPSPLQNVIVTGPTGTPTYVEGTDYTVDMDLARITILPNSTIPAGTNILVDYRVGARNRVQVLSGSTPVEGSMRFIAANPKGLNRDYFMPWVKITPNGDYALKGEEWQQIPFNIEVLKRAGYEAIYIDGRPFTP